eukprot:scaffold162244_cov32-Tisochrysis_lutea.AAC.3
MPMWVASQREICRRTRCVSRCVALPKFEGVSEHPVSNCALGMHGGGCTWAEGDWAISPPSPPNGIKRVECASTPMALAFTPTP